MTLEEIMAGFWLLVTGVSIYVVYYVVMGVLDEIRANRNKNKTTKKF